MDGVSTLHVSESELIVLDAVPAVYNQTKNKLTLLVGWLVDWLVGCPRSGAGGRAELVRCDVVMDDAGGPGSSTGGARVVMTVQGWDDGLDDGAMTSTLFGTNAATLACTNGRSMFRVDQRA